MKKTDVEKATEILNNMAERVNLTIAQLEKMDKILLDIKFALDSIADVLADIVVRSDGK